MTIQENEACAAAITVHRGIWPVSIKRIAPGTICDAEVIRHVQIAVKKEDYRGERDLHVLQACYPSIGGRIKKSTSARDVVVASIASEILKLFLGSL